MFTNPVNRTAFDFKEEDGNHTADVVKIDSRFTSLLKWLGDSRINVRLSGTNREDGYAVYRIRETAFGGGTKLSAEDGFLQFMIERLLESNAPAEAEEDEEQEENGDEMKLTSIQSITDFMTCAAKHCRIISDSGPEEIWQWQDPVKFLRKSAIMHRGLFLLC